MIKRILISVAAIGLAACSLDKQAAPALSGPSEFALSLQVTASPDLITQDGLSQSTISVLARDAYSQPVRGLTFRADMLVGTIPADFGTLSSRVLSTTNDGVASATYTSPAPPPATATSDNTVTIRLTPVGTNYSNETPRTVTIRLVRPSVITPPSGDLAATFVMSSTTPNVGDTVTFDASGSSVGSGRTITGYSWNFGDGTSGSGKTTSHAFRDPGTFAVSLTITDDLGRVATASQVLTAKSNAPTTVDFVFSPTDPLTGELVVFNGSLSSAASGRTIRSYSWDFGDGNTGSGVTAQHAFKTDRTYTVVLTVTDDLGQTGSKSKTVKVSSLTAVFTVTPTNPAVGETVKVSATGGANSTYAWDFGNGRSATTQSATTTYTAVGTYTIVLTLTDSLGNVATASASVTVK